MSAPEPRADFSSLLLSAPALQSCLVSQIFFMSLSFSLRINSVVFCLVYMVTKIKTLTVDEAGFRFSLTVYWQSGLPLMEEGGEEGVGKSVLSLLLQSSSRGTRSRGDICGFHNWKEYCWLLWVPCITPAWRGVLLIPVKPH